MLRRLLLAGLLALLAIASIPAEASHQTSSGIILAGDGPQSLCGESPPPGYNIHKKDPEISAMCFEKPFGATGLILRYTKVHPHSDLGCMEQGNKIMVYGLKTNLNPPYLPTLLQSFTIEWTHGAAVANWAPCT